MKKRIRLRWGRGVFIIAVCLALTAAALLTARLFDSLLSAGKNATLKNAAENGQMPDACLDGIPILYQTDTRWNDKSYGDSTIGISGCAPTCIAMVAAGLTGDTDITPDKVADYAFDNGYYESGSGTSWQLMTGCGKVFGIKGKEICLSKDVMDKHLAKGNPIICSMRPGDFTDEGHFIVLAGMTDGMYIVHDPNSRERTMLLWDFDRLAPQIKNLWAFRKR